MTDSMWGWVGVFYNGKGNNFRDDTELKITLEIEYCVLILEYIFKIQVNFFFFLSVFSTKGVLAFTASSKGFLPPKKLGVTDSSLFVSCEEQTEIYGLSGMTW